MSPKQTRQRRRRDERRGSKASKGRRWWIAGAVAALLVSLLLVSGGGSEEGTTPTAEGTFANIVMEDFAGNDLTISSLQGRPAVLNFWASWCAPCLAEMPGFEAVYQRRRDTVQFLGINLTDAVEPALAVVEYTGVTYPLARDTEGEVFAALGGYGMPTTIFLDANGQVLERVTGELTADQLEARIVEYFET